MRPLNQFSGLVTKVLKVNWENSYIYIYIYIYIYNVLIETSLNQHLFSTSFTNCFMQGEVLLPQAIIRNCAGYNNIDYQDR